jgi:hypothetical protein
VKIRAHNLLSVAGLGSRLNAEGATRRAARGERCDDSLGAGVEGARMSGLCKLSANVAVVAEGRRGRGGSGVEKVR